MQHNHNLNCNYNLMGFDTIEINLVYTCTFSSCSLKVLGRGRFHFLLFGDEDVEDCDRDTPNDDDEGENGAWRINLHSSSETSKHSAPKLHIKVIVLRL